MENSSTKSNTLPAIILSIGIIISTVVGSTAFYYVRSFDNSLSTTGSAKQDIVSDTVKWNAMYTRVVTLPNLKSGYAQMANDEKLVRDFLKNKGISESDFTISPISMDEVYEYRPNGDTGPKQYNLRQQVSVNSNDVEKITSIAKDVQSLIGQGVVFSSGGLEYYYSKLADLRVSLLSDAIKDAKARAEKIAEASGKNVGQLKSASSGVVQVLPQNSVEVSDYGSYATGDMKKTVMVTVKASFTLK